RPCVLQRGCPLPRRRSAVSGPADTATATIPPRPPGAEVPRSVVPPDRVGPEAERLSGPWDYLTEKDIRLTDVESSSEIDRAQESFAARPGRGTARVPACRTLGWSGAPRIQVRGAPLRSPSGSAHAPYAARGPPGGQPASFSATPSWPASAGASMMPVSRQDRKSGV